MFSSTASVTNCHKLSALKQQSFVNQNSVHSTAQLVPCPRFHKADIRGLAGLCSLLEALGNEPSSKFIQAVGRVQFHVPVGRTSISLLAISQGSFSASRGNLCIL